MNALLRSLPAAALALLCGCQTTTEQEHRSASTVDDLRSLQQAIAAGRGSVDDAVSALTQLSREGGDMSSEYGVYSRSVEAVEVQRERVRELQANLARQRREFTADWGENVSGIQDASLRGRSRDRREEVVDAFSRLDDALTTTRQRLDNWLTDLKDVRAYLEYDLNPSGVRSVQDEIESIDRRSGDVESALAELASTLGDLVEKLDAPMPAQGALSGS